MPRTMSVSDSVVIAATPERLFAEISDPTQMQRWSPENRGATVDGGGRAAYVGMSFVDFAAAPEGTLVTETWTDGRRRWPDAVANRFDRFATGGRTFAEFQQRNIAKTLARLKAGFESR